MRMMMSANKTKLLVITAIALLILLTLLHLYQQKNAKLSSSFSSLTGLLLCFETSGCLLHMIDMNSDWLRCVFADRRPPKRFPIETDCGEFCSAFSLLRCDLPLTAYSTSFYVLNSGMVFAAEGMWPHVTCMACLDSNSINRVCCVSQETDNGEFSPQDSPYCVSACGESASDNRRPLTPTTGGISNDASERPTTTECRERRSGCGRHLSEIGAYEPTVGLCQSENLAAGFCPLCLDSPLWCSELFSLGTTNNTQDAEKESLSLEEDLLTVSARWMHTYYRSAAHVRQCKFKPTEREAFVQTARTLYQEYQKAPEAEIVALNTEVNVYVDPYLGNSEFLRHWLGWTFNESTGDSENLLRLREARDRLSSYDESLWRPIFCLHMEAPLSLKLWAHETCVDLRLPPYNLRVL